MSICGHCGACCYGVRNGQECEQIAALRQRAETAERDHCGAIGMLKLVYEQIRTRGHIENHGHRRPGSACGVCAIVNELERLVGNSPSP